MITSPESTPSPQRRRPWGKGLLALAGTIVFPGLGHLFAGRGRRAFGWLVLAVVVQLVSCLLLTNARLIMAAFVMVPIVLMLTLCIHLDAFLCGRRSKKPMLGKAWLRYAAALLLIVFSSFFFHPWAWVSYSLADYVRDHYAEALVVSGRSMSPTLLPGDRFIAHKHANWVRWSVVVINHPSYQSPDVVTRVVGLPGEGIEIIDGELGIDGRPMDRPPAVGPYLNLDYPYSRDPYLRGKPGAGCEGNPIHLQENEYFVLGDNSALAHDARLWDIAIPGHQLGALPGEHIHGRVTAIYWPPKRWRLFD